MSHQPETDLQALVLIAEENYAHARDHEHLRAQVTSTLVAAAFVLIGLAIGSNLHGAKLVYVAVLSISIGLLNVVLVLIHNNRFDRHVSIARDARRRISSVEAEASVSKLFSLSAAWLLVACLPVLAGVGLYFVK